MGQTTIFGKPAAPDILLRSTYEPHCDIRPTLL